jgi:hypothetical protein
VVMSTGYVVLNGQIQGICRWARRKDRGIPALPAPNVTDVCAVCRTLKGAVGASGAYLTDQRSL